jgi:hypothetical protein
LLKEVEMKHQSSYQLGYDCALGCHVSRGPILAGCDDSSIVIACHSGALPSLEEERQRDLPSNLQLAVVELCDSMSEDVPSNP